MSEVWKEFFRLKWIETHEFRKVILTIFGIFSVIFVLCYPIGKLMWLIYSGWYVGFELTFWNYMLGGLCVIILIIFTIMCIFCTLLITWGIIELVEWLRSNWKQAKENVEQRRKRK